MCHQQRNSAILALIAELSTESLSLYLYMFLTPHCPTLPQVQLLFVNSLWLAEGQKCYTSLSKEPLLSSFCFYHHCIMSASSCNSVIHHLTEVLWPANRKQGQFCIPLMPFYLALTSFAIIKSRLNSAPIAWKCFNPHCSIPGLQKRKKCGSNYTQQFDRGRLCRQGLTAVLQAGLWQRHQIPTTWWWTHFSNDF